MNPDLWPVALVAFVCACTCLPAREVDERALDHQRDLALLGGVALAGLAAFVAGEYWCCPLALWAGVRWRASTMLPSVVVWVAIAALWRAALGIAHLSDIRVVLILALVTIAIGQCSYAAWQSWNPGPNPRAPRGTFGQRTLLAAFLAMVWPLTTLWPRPLAVITGAIIIIGLILTASWVAWLAALAAFTVLEPVAGAVVTGAAALTVALALAISGAWRSDVPRGNHVYHALHIGSVTHRWRTWRCALTRWPTSLERLAFGADPGELKYDLLRWDARFKANLITGHAHSEPIQLVYEYGLCGAAAIGLFVWRVAPGLAWGDPWSAAAIAGAVCACASITCRTPATGVPWLVVCAVVAARSASA
jgi:hypothetical protein